MSTFVKNLPSNKTSPLAPDMVEPCLQCRFVLYKKGLKDTVDIVSPKVYGGMKSDEHMALNPQGLIPMLVLPGGKALWESDVSASLYSAPCCIKALPASKAACAKLAVVHDTRDVCVCR